VVFVFNTSSDLLISDRFFKSIELIAFLVFSIAQLASKVIHTFLNGSVNEIRVVLLLLRLLQA